MVLFRLWTFYLAFAAAVLFGLRWLRRRVPTSYAAAFLLLPVLFCLPGFFAARTLFPTDHVRLLPPWRPSEARRPYNPNLNDAVTQFAPWAKAVQVAWKEGSLPLRNRWNGCGSALAANGQSGVFSPFSWPALALPIAGAVTLAAAWKLFLALAGTWLWLREAGVSAESALFGGVAFAFSMTMTPWLLFPLSAVFCLWPWAFFAIELLGDPAIRVRAFAALTAIFATWVLVGHPESAVLGALAVGVCLLGRAGARDRAVLPGLIVRVLAAGALAAALTAFLWLPQLLAIRASSRLTQAQEFRAHLPVSAVPHGPAWRYGLLTSLSPRSLGDDVASPRISGAAGSFSEMALAYFGIVGWAMALLIFRPGASRSRAELALAGLLLCGLATGSATWPVFDLFLSLPLVRLVLPLRFLSWVALAGAAVAAFEIDRLLRDRAEGRKPLLFLLGAPALLAAVLCAAYLRLRPLHAATGGLTSQRHALALSLAALVGVAALVLLSFASARIAAAVPALLAVLLGAELFLQGERLYRWGSPADVFPATPLVRFLEAQKRPFRVVGEGSALFPGTNIFAGVEDIRTHDAVERRDYVELLGRTCGYDRKEYFKAVRDTEAPVFDFLNVRYLVSGDPSRPESGRWRRVYAGPDGSIFENGRVLPRIFAPARIRFVGGSGGSTDLPAGDWGAEATVSGHPDVLPGRTATRANVAVDVSDYRETTNAVRFEAAAAGPGRPVLVTSLVDDGGWTASDERGAPVPTVRANGVFLGVTPEPGRHEIRLDYAPPGFSAGLAISGTTLVGLLGAAGFNRMRQRPFRDRQGRRGGAASEIRPLHGGPGEGRAAR